MMQLKAKALLRKAFLRKALPGATVLGAAFLCGAAQAQTPVYPTDLTNIAAASNGGHIVSSTSTFENSDDWNAKNLIDGQVSSAQGGGSLGWSSNKFDPQGADSVTLAFANDATKRIGKIVLNPASAVPPERWAKDVEMQVSTTGPDGPYRTAALITLKREAKPQAFLILPTTAKYVRLLFRSNQGSDRAVSLGEVEMYEAIPQTDAIGQLIARMEQAVAELKQYRELDVQRRNTIASNETGVHNVLTSPPAPSDATLQLVQLLLKDDAPAFPVSNINIAAAKNGGKIMNYSSLFGGDAKYAAKNLIDSANFDIANQDSSWGWSSEGFAPGREYVTLGFSEDRSHLIGKVTLNPSANQPLGRWARRVDIQVTSASAKDGPWRTIATVTLRPDPVNQEFLLRPTEAKYLRFVFQANGPSDINLPGLLPGVSSDRAVSLGEIEVYEASSTSGALDSVIGRFEGILTDLKNLRHEQATKADTAPRPSAAQVS